MPYFINIFRNRQSFFVYLFTIYDLFKKFMCIINKEKDMLFSCRKERLIIKNIIYETKESAKTVLHQMSDYAT